MLMGDLLTLNQIGAAGEGRGLQQRVTGLRAAGDACGRSPLLRRRADQSRTSPESRRPSGTAGISVPTTADVAPAIQQALAHDGPALLDVRMHTQELVMPPSLQLEQVGGFALYLARAVLSGRGDEVIDLARTS